MPKKGRQATRMTPGFTGPYKGAPQQGTLFDKRALDQAPANVAQTEQRVGPRGYSPARVREIRGAFQPKVTMHKQELEEGDWGGTNTYTFGHRNQNFEAVKAGDEPAETKVSYSPVAESDKYLYGVTPIKYRDRIREGTFVGSPAARAKGEEGPYEAINRSMGRAKSKMVETLARSTVPASDLEGLTSIDIKGKEPGKENYAGYYQSHIGRGPPASQHAASTQELIPGVTPREEKAGRIVLSPGEDYKEPGQSEMTLLHELGHHASWMRGQSSAMYHAPHLRAAEESFADRYSMQHFRQRADRTGREKTKSNWPEGAQRSIDPRTHSYGARGNYGPDEMPEEGRWSVHQPEYHLEPHMVLPEHLQGGGPSDRHYPTHHEERWQRPMLDEGGAETFKPEHMGITRPLTPERAMKNEPPDRADIYKRNAYTAGDALNREHVVAAKQWEVRRNVHPALVGQQFR